MLLYNDAFDYWRAFVGGVSILGIFAGLNQKADLR